MLFFAAAILFSSAHVLGVAGPSVVPEASSPVSQVSASSTTVHLVDTRGVAGLETDSPTLSAPEEGVPAEVTLSACGGDARGRASPAPVIVDECLDALGSVPVSLLERFDASLDADAGQDVAFATILDRRGSAATTRTWWMSLSAIRQSDLISELPSVVGNLEGVPYDVRDTANRLTLDSTIQALEIRSAGGLTALATEGSRLEMLQRVQAALRPGTEQNDSTRGLVSLDTVYPGRAAIAVGDLDTADNVSVIVPGMLYTVSTQMVSLTGAAASLQSEQSSWSSTLATSATEAPATSAVVAWMGYRTPGLTNVLSLDLAQSGARRLEDALQGLAGERASDPPRVTLIAHSYGSTTATIALSSGRVHVDDFVAMGSPGSVVATASRLDVTPGQVFAAAAPLDPVAGSGVFGADPGSMAFGAKLLNLGASVDPFTEQKVTAVLSHNQYFTAGGQAMRSLALIGIGRGDLAGGRTPDPDGPHLMDGPTMALIRPQDVNRESIAA